MLNPLNKEGNAVNQGLIWARYIPHAGELIIIGANLSDSGEKLWIQANSPFEAFQNHTQLNSMNDLLKYVFGEEDQTLAVKDIKTNEIYSEQKINEFELWFGLDSLEVQMLKISKSESNGL